VFGGITLDFFLPIEQVLSLGPRLVQEGAQAISIAMPRGALTKPDSPLITGRLYGPSVFPRTLETVYSAAKLGLPIIGAGGVWTKENADAILSAGSLAVQVDAALWGFNWQGQSSME
jgi:dihydroorotate dehydrogenase